MACLGRIITAHLLPVVGVCARRSDLDSSLVEDRRDENGAYYSVFCLLARAAFVRFVVSRCSSRCSAMPSCSASNAGSRAMRGIGVLPPRTEYQMISFITRGSAISACARSCSAVRFLQYACVLFPGARAGTLR